MENNPNIASDAQHVVNLVLIWLGFGTLVALIVRSIVPGKEPSGPISTILIGIVGTCVGPLVVSLVWRIENFNPIGPVGFLASFVCALFCLLAYQVGHAMFSRRRREYER